MRKRIPADISSADRVFETGKRLLTSKIGLRIAEVSYILVFRQ